MKQLTLLSCLIVLAVASPWSEAQLEVEPAARNQYTAHEWLERGRMIESDGDRLTCNKNKDEPLIPFQYWRSIANMQQIGNLWEFDADAGYDLPVVFSTNMEWTGLYSVSLDKTILLETSLPPRGINKTPLPPVKARRYLVIGGTSPERSLYLAAQAKETDLHQSLRTLSVKSGSVLTVPSTRFHDGAQIEKERKYIYVDVAESCLDLERTSKAWDGRSEVIFFIDPGDGEVNAVPVDWTRPSALIPTQLDQLDAQALLFNLLTDPQRNRVPAVTRFWFQCLQEPKVSVDAATGNRSITRIPTLHFHISFADRLDLAQARGAIEILLAYTFFTDHDCNDARLLHWNLYGPAGALLEIEVDLTTSKQRSRKYAMSRDELKEEISQKIDDLIRTGSAAHGQESSSNAS